LTFYGMMAGANDVSVNSQAAAVERALGRSTMSRFHAMFSVAGMIGASVGGMLAARGISPRLHLGIACVVFLAFATYTARFLMETHDEAPENPMSKRRGHLPPALIALTVIGASMFLSEGAIADWAAVYLKQVLRSGPGSAAAAYAVFSAFMAIFRFLGDAVANRLGPVRTVRSGAILAGCGLTLALLAPSPAWSLPGFALTGVGFSVIVPLVFAAGGRVPSIPQAAGIALVSGSGYIGFLFGPPLIGFLAQLTSLRVALFSIVALSALSAALAGAVGPDQSATNSHRLANRR
jgi:predicted MFS family arabinose efflux permease